MKQKLSPLAQKFLEHISHERWLHSGERVGVAVSGGADSVALLRLLLELRSRFGVVLGVVHFDHRIRGAESKRDAKFVADLAKKYDLEFFGGADDTRAFAHAHKLSLEAAARRLRYGFFDSLLAGGKIDLVLTAHTLDDQAETVLLRLLRGAGTRGLAGILPRMSTSSQAGKTLRPLLDFRRAELRAYLKSLRQPWREDKSNRDLRHTRNRLRKKLMPLLEREFNPEIARLLAETAEIARAENEFWREHLTTLPEFTSPHGAIRTASLLQLPLALQRRVLLELLERAGMGADFRHIEKLRRLAAEKCGLQPRRLQLPGGEAILRDGELVISPNEAKKSPSASAPESYEYALAVPGELMLPELGISLRARLATGAEANGKSAHAGYNLPLAAAKIGAGLRIRNWRAGERFWPLGRRAPKKIKELLQKIPAERRKLWPVAATASGELVWMLGFPPATSWAERQANAPGIVIEEANESRKKLTRAS